MHDIDAPAIAPDRKDSFATIRAAIHGKAARRREAADVNELVSDFGFLLVSFSLLLCFARLMGDSGRLMPPPETLNPRQQI